MTPQAHAAADSSPDTLSWLDNLPTLAHRWLIVLALVLLSISMIALFVAVNQAVSVWLRPQWAPLARAGTAMALALLSLVALWRLTARRR